jgi:PPOX class probable F420-dependent enzyme
VTRLTAEQAALFNGPNFIALATVRDDGSPHVSPVWGEYDGEHVVFNTAERRAKWHHIRRDPRVTLTVWSGDNPYSYVEVTGTAELVSEGADAHIDKMAKKYLGEDVYPFRAPGEVRVIVKVTPELVEPGA